MDGVEHEVRSDRLLEAHPPVEPDDGAAADGQEEEEIRVGEAGRRRQRDAPVEHGADKAAQEPHQNRESEPLHEGEGTEAVVFEFVGEPFFFHSEEIIP